jgi:hypothetical protein
LTDPRSTYSERLAARRASRDAFALRDKLISWARPIVFAAGALALYAAYTTRSFPAAAAWASVPVFFVLVYVHERVVRRRNELVRRARHYERGLERLDEKWSGKGIRGDDLAPPDHPYAADLDLFGSGSLFERLCTCRTRPGEEALAQMLLGPAAADEVRARQAAVAELRERLSLREDLEVLGDAVRAEVSIPKLAEWAAAPRRLASALLPWALGALAAATVGLLSAAVSGALPWGWFVLALAAELVVLGRLRDTVDAVSAAVDGPGRHLQVLALVLARLEREQFQSDKLRALRAMLVEGDDAASARIAALGRRVDFLFAQRNQMFIPFAILLVWGPQWACAIEAWRARSGGAITRWLSALGELEALSALAGYAFERPDDPFPELVDGPLFEGSELGHPLIPDTRSVRNDVHLDAAQRLYLISGSNMSGKSTLLRTVGTNVVLALAGAPVRAKKLTLSPLQLGATLRVQDSLAEGASRFFAEVKRLKTLVELARGKPPLLFLLDEILHGTNSHDRRLGAEAVVKGLLERGALGLCTTHDLALAEMAEALGPVARNVHFEDTLEDGELRFDYKMRPGVVRRSNALALMRAVGLDVPS